MLSPKAQFPGEWGCLSLVSCFITALCFDTIISSSNQFFMLFTPTLPKSLMAWCQLAPEEIWSRVFTQLNVNVFSVWRNQNYIHVYVLTGHWRESHLISLYEDAHCVKHETSFPWIYTFWLYTDLCATESYSNSCCTIGVSQLSSYSFDISYAQKNVSIDLGY